jgi:hypothetical protein
MTPGRSLSPCRRLSVATDVRPLRSPPRPLVAAACLLVVATIGILALVGTGGATVVDGHYTHGDGTDSSAPIVANGSKVNATAVAVTISDNHDVDESTIEASDFLLSDGSIRNVSVAENGSNATVTLLLDQRLNRDELTVVIASGATILDTNGNVLDSSATNSVAVVENMDSVPPSLSEFTVTNATGGPATIRLAGRESLGDFHLTITGPTTETLDISDFEEASDPFAWEATYSPAADGTYGVYLQNYTDTSGNTRKSSRNGRFVADLSPPDAVAALDLANSQNLSIAFDAGRSSDNSGIASYRWTFGDGDTATGRSVTHDFLPGNYTVTLNVTDIYGNAATDSITLNLTQGSGNVTDINDSELRERAGTDRSVSVRRPGNETTDSALVGVENARRNDSVAVGTLGDGEPLAVHGPVSLDGIAVTLATNRSFDLGVSVAGNGSVADAAAPGRVPIAGVTVVNSISDDEIRNATVGFSVDGDRLNALGVTPANVSLYRFSDGSWNALTTTVSNASDGRRAYEAETPGFSRFAIATSVPTNPDFAVTDATLDTQRVTPGERFSVTATVANTGNGDGTFVGGLEANGTVVATGQATVAAGETGTLTLHSRTSDTGTYELTVNDTVAGTVTVAPAESSGGSDDDSTAGSDDGSTTGTTDDETRQFVVTNASLGASQVAVDEPFAVNATIENRGEERGNYTAGLIVDGTVAVTQTRPIPPGESLTVQFDYLMNRSGEFPVSVNGTSAGTLAVSGTDGNNDGGDGLFASVLGVLPIGLLRPLLLFVVAPVVVIWGILKALAIYLGY